MMLIKLAAIGTLGYVGYRYLRERSDKQDNAPERVALAGGPLSPQATVQHNPDDIPPTTVQAAESARTTH
ncbi:hypothetical protein [Novosphingobium sp. M1R2S20]|uniref:Uncharacterized protein n=1 Tax=Novosphingobium rhizovicinum TaxID=3228928 RepID=A0ABV3RBL4_9SPHN